MSRIYRGEDRGRRLAAWLNSNRTTEYGVLVVAWRGVLLVPATAGLMKIGRLSVRGKTIDAPIPELLERYMRRENELMLARASRARFDPRSGSFSFTCDDSTAVHTPLHSTFALYREGLLDRLKACSGCGMWFYRRFRHQDFCSTECRQKFYRSGPKWKAHRAEYMRDYRTR